MIINGTKKAPTMPSYACIMPATDLRVTFTKSCIHDEFSCVSVSKALPRLQQRPLVICTVVIKKEFPLSNENEIIDNVKKFR